MWNEHHSNETGLKECALQDNLSSIQSNQDWHVAITTVYSQNCVIWILYKTHLQLWWKHLRMEAYDDHHWWQSHMQANLVESLLVLCLGLCSCTDEWWGWQKLVFTKSLQACLILIKVIILIHLGFCCGCGNGELSDSCRHGSYSFYTHLFSNHRNETWYFMQWGKRKTRHLKFTSFNKIVAPYLCQRVTGSSARRR